MAAIQKLPPTAPKLPAVVRSAIPRYGRGATSLRGIKDITLSLEDGTEVTYNVALELAKIPADPVALYNLLIESPAQLAFWSAQHGRALRVARLLEKELAQHEGFCFYCYKTEMTNNLGNSFTDSSVKYRVDADEGVLDKRRQVVEAYAHADLLRAIRDSVEHRTYLLRELAARAGREQT